MARGVIFMLYTVKEVAARLKTNVNFVYTLINLGLLKSLKLGSRKVRDKSLEEFLDKYDGTDIDEIIAEAKKGIQDREGAAG